MDLVNPWPLYTVLIFNAKIYKNSTNAYFIYLFMSLIIQRSTYNTYMYYTNNSTEDGYQYLSLSTYAAK